MEIIKGKLRPLRKNILVTDMSFEERKTSSGIILRSDDGKSHGVRPRWARVWAIGPEQTDVKIGEWVYIEHGRWTRGVEVEENGKKFTVRMVDPDSVLLTSEEEPKDYYVGE